MKLPSFFAAKQSKPNRTLLFTRASKPNQTLVSYFLIFCVYLPFSHIEYFMLSAKVADVNLVSLIDYISFCQKCRNEWTWIEFLMQLCQGTSSVIRETIQKKIIQIGKGGGSTQSLHFWDFELLKITSFKMGICYVKMVDNEFKGLKKCF